MSRRRARKALARPAVLRHIPLDRHVVIDASAGTGKTFTLENLVVELVLSTDLTIDRLLCVTFTEKATHELRARVRGKFESLLVGPRRAGDRRADPRRGRVDARRARAARSSAAALHAFDAATIATIHAFCHRVLRENAFASGRCFEEQAGRRTRGVRARLARRAARRRRARSGAGSLARGGAAERLVHRTHRGAPLELRARARADPARVRPRGARSGARSVPRRRRARAQEPRRAQGVGRPRADRGDDRAARCRTSRTSSSGARRGDAPLFVREAKDVVGQAARPPAGRSRLVRGVRPGSCAAALDLARATPPFAAAIAHALLDGVKGELARGKRAAGRYDFDDMLSLVDDALRGPRGGALAEAMRQRWRYALIDEFQDTDETQWSIFRRAFFERGAGAHAERAPRRRRSEAVDLPLPRRRRGHLPRGERRGASRPAVRASASATTTARRRRSSRRRTASSTRTRPTRSSPATSRTSRSRAAARTALSSTARGGRCRRLCALRFEGDDAAARTWAPGSRARLARPRTRRAPGASTGAPSTTATSSCSRAAGAKGARSAGRSAPRACRTRSTRRTVSSRPRRRETSAPCYAAIDDPDDPGTPRGRVADAVLRSAARRRWSARAASPRRILCSRGSTPGRRWPTRATSTGSSRASSATPGFVRREIFFADGERDLTNTLHLLEVLTEHARGGRATLRDLVQELAGLIAKTRLPLDLEGNMQRLESDRRAVQIMTIHKAKGLEAPLVFVAGGLTAGGSDGERVRVYPRGRPAARVGRQPVAGREADRRRRGARGGAAPDVRRAHAGDGAPLPAVRAAGSTASRSRSAGPTIR